jgi:hypothetical protein
MKPKLLTLSLWLVRAMLAFLVLFWTIELLSLVIAYFSAGREGIGRQILHISAVGVTFPSPLDPAQTIHMAYQGFILIILLTWMLRELHSYLGRAAKRRALL